MNEELAPCPFCRQQEAAIFWEDTLFYVFCKYCYARGPATHSNAEAAQAWNTWKNYPTETEEEKEPKK